MGRYGTEHKEATRRRIVETAGRRLKRDGIDGSGIATLMADAGLTNGAFYARFPVQGRPDRQRRRRGATSPAAWVDTLLPGRAGVEQLRARVPVPRAPRLPRCGLPVGRAARRNRPVRHRDQWPTTWLATCAPLSTRRWCALCLYVDRHTMVRGQALGLSVTGEVPRGQVRQGAQGGDAAADHRYRRPALQEGRDRQVRRRDPDGRRRAHQRCLLRPLRLQGRPRRDGRRGPAWSTGVGVQQAAGRPRRTRGIRARVPFAGAPGPPRRRLPVGSTARRDRAVHRSDQEGVHRRRQGGPGRDLHAPGSGGSGVGARGLRSCCSRCSSGRCSWPGRCPTGSCRTPSSRRASTARRRFSPPGRRPGRRRALPVTRPTGRGVAIPAFLDYRMIII